MNYKLDNSIQAILTRAFPSDEDGLQNLAMRLTTTTNILKVFRSGDIRVPLDRAFGMADALGVDCAEFFSACLAQYLSDEDMTKFDGAFGRDPRSQHEGGEIGDA